MQKEDFILREIKKISMMLQMLIKNLTVRQEKLPNQFDYELKEAKEILRENGFEMEEFLLLDPGRIVSIKNLCGRTYTENEIMDRSPVDESIRMKPVFMILGQIAGTLAAMVIDRKGIVHDVSYEELRPRLIEDGQILENPEE